MDLEQVRKQVDAARQDRDWSSIVSVTTEALREGLSSREEEVTVMSWRAKALRRQGREGQAIRALKDGLELLAGVRAPRLKASLIIDLSALLADLPDRGAFPDLIAAFEGAVIEAPDLEAWRSQILFNWVSGPPTFGGRQRVTGRMATDGEGTSGKPSPFWLEGNRKNPWAKSWQTPRGSCFRRFPSRTCLSYFLWGAPSKPTCGFMVTRVRIFAFHAPTAGERPCTSMASTIEPP